MRASISVGLRAVGAAVLVFGAAGTALAQPPGYETPALGGYLPPGAPVGGQSLPGQ